MACSRNYVRKGATTFGVTITPLTAVERVDVGYAEFRRPVEQNPNPVRTASATALAPPQNAPWTPGGSPWSVGSPRRAEIGVFVAPVGGRVRIDVEVGGNVVEQLTCTSTNYPVWTGFLGLTTWS